MKKKLIVVDLDGTALHDDHHLNPISKKALLAAKKAGHTVMIATGRSARESLHFYKELELDTPLINSNGAYLHHPNDENFQAITEQMSIDLLVDIFNSPISKYLLNGVCEYKDELYILQEDEGFTYFMNLGACDSVAYGAFNDSGQKDFTRFILKIEPGFESDVKAYLETHYPGQLSYYQWEMGEQVVFEITRGGVNKASAIAAAADRLGFTPEDIIVFGDGSNDMEMLTFAGTGVAMGNAIAQLQAIANATTLSNTEGGIAHYLYQHLLKDDPA